LDTGRRPRRVEVATLPPDPDGRAEQLHAEGARLLAERWDEAVGMVRHEAQGYHDPRATLAYALVLLRDAAPDDLARAERAITNVLSLQERRDDDAHLGNFRWLYEDEVVTDLNAVEFFLDALVEIVADHGARLAPGTAAAVRDAIALGLEEIDRLDVHPSYTNVALSDICNSVLGGEAVCDDACVERGRRRLDEWLEFTARSGAPHEFNSPTYCALDILGLAALAARTRDEAIALRARVAEERLWLHVATHYHPSLAQLAGPHSRSYRDGWTGAPGYLKLLLWRLLGDDALRRVTPYFPRGREEAHTAIAAAELHCPAYVQGWLREKRFPFECTETADREGGLDITTCMAEGWALGTASRSYTVGAPPEPWPMFNSTLLHFRRDRDPGYGALYARYVIDDAGAGDADRAADFPDGGRHVAAQSRNRAIVAYGLVPRLRPLRSAKLSVRIFGVDEASDVWCGGERVTRFPAAVEPGEAVVVAEGDACIALVPLEPSDMGSGAPVELRIDDGQLVLDIYNYLGPAKSFWEHRSQAGPFYRGNVRNAFALEVASRSEFADVDAFRRHIGEARIADSVEEDYAREIVYASDGGSVSLRYSLWDMSVLERRYDGVPFASAMGRAGAADGSGMLWLQSRDSLIELGGAKLLAGRTPKWLAADPEARRYAFANPSDEVAPVWLETPRSVVECDAFGFGRIELDERAGTLAVEADGDIGPLRLRAAPGTRVTINGVDVTDAMPPPDDTGVRAFRGL
jgi:hypothetical protein